MVYIDAEKSGQKIKEKLKERNMTQKLLSMKIGTYPQIVVRWVKGKNSPTVYMLYMMSKVLDCNMEDLIYVVDDGKEIEVKDYDL